MLSLAAVLAIGSVSARGQDFVAPNATAVRDVSKPEHEGSGRSWVWVHAGVAVQAAGSFADWATSWKQPEGNPWLAEPTGPYAGRFYRTGTAEKAGLSAGLALVSYGLAWKWPRLRKYIGVFNMAVGAGFGGAAVYNVTHNPYYKP